MTDCEAVNNFKYKHKNEAVNNYKFEHESEAGNKYKYKHKDLNNLYVRTRERGFKQLYVQTKGFNKNIFVKNVRCLHSSKLSQLQIQNQRPPTSLYRKPQQ